MFEVRENLTGQLIKEGRFFHPSDGVSIYIRESNKNGEMRGIFLTDARNYNNNLTYSAREAVLNETENGLLLIMQDGLLQIANNKKIQLTTISFDRLGLSLNEFFPKGATKFLIPTEVFPLQILHEFSSIDGVNYLNEADYKAEAHLKIATPLTPIALTLLALTIFLITGYKRKTFALPIYTGILLGLTMQALTLSLRSIIAENNSLFWVIYFPPLVTILLTIVLISVTQNYRNKDTTP